MASDWEVPGCASADGTGVRVALGVLVEAGRAVGDSFGASDVVVGEGWISTVGVDAGSTAASGSSGTGVGTTSAPHADSRTATPTPAIAVRGSRVINLFARIFFNTSRSTSGSAK